jgi:hypothetical protein
MDVGESAMAGRSSDEWARLLDFWSHGGTGGHDARGSSGPIGSLLVGLLALASRRGSCEQSWTDIASLGRLGATCGHDSQRGALRAGAGC